VAAAAALLFFLAVGSALADDGQPEAPESQPRPQLSPAAATRVPTAAAKSPVPSPTPAEPTATGSPASEPAAAAPPARPAGDCDAYVDSDEWCVDGAGDYDCAGGTGNGPNYVDGPVRVVDPGRDPFGLDRDGDGRACERQAADPAPPPPPPDDGTDPRFDTCGAAIAAGYGPYHRGQDPEYDWYRDADGDGIVCE
jgi:hypothetical protein